MNNIKIVANSAYFPQKEVKNNDLEKYLNLENGYIEKRTGIRNRYYAINEKIEDMALKAVQNMIKQSKQQDCINNVDLIIVATTSTNILMPGIANYIQKMLEMTPCMCLDILAGCNGYINALDIAKTYIDSGRINKALIIGVDKLSDVIDKEDVGTAIVLSDGAGATLIEKDTNCHSPKKYISNIQSEGKNNEILTYEYGKKLYMNGKEIYKYAVTETVDNIKELLHNAKLTLEDITYIVPHQSNLKIMKAIASRLHIDMNKMYTNIQTRGNTFCASIPIALYDMQNVQQLNEGDKIILLGYGGGLNTGSILLEI